MASTRVDGSTELSVLLKSLCCAKALSHLSHLLGDAVTVEAVALNWGGCDHNIFAQRVRSRTTLRARQWAMDRGTCQASMGQRFCASILVRWEFLKRVCVHPCEFEEASSHGYKKDVIIP